MRDNGARSIWMSCYKQLSLSYQSSGRGGGSPLGASALPPRRRSFARAAVVLASFVVASRARSSAPRRMCAPRRCAVGGRCAAALAVSSPALVLVGGSCAGSSRLRALRRALHGGYVVERHYTLRCSGAQTTTYGAAQQGYHFLRRHVRRRKYFSACKRARRPPEADGACAAVRPQTSLSKK